MESNPARISESRQTHKESNSYFQSYKFYKFLINFFSLWYMGSGAYIVSNYFSYSIANEQDRAYLSNFMLILYIWASYTYLKCAYTIPKQTCIEKNIELQQVKYKGKPAQNIDFTKFNGHCEFCKAKKFERSSHCRQCGFCVLRRDHHCFWLGICIGFHNLQYFINFVIVAFV